MRTLGGLGPFYDLFPDSWSAKPALVFTFFLPMHTQAQKRQSQTVFDIDLLQSPSQEALVATESIRLVSNYLKSGISRERDLGRHQTFWCKFCLVESALAVQLYTVVCVNPHNKPAWRSTPLINAAIAIKIQLQQEGLHNPHKGYTWSTQLKWSRILCHWVSQDTCIRPPYKDWEI